MADRRDYGRKASYISAGEQKTCAAGAASGDVGGWVRMSTLKLGAWFAARVLHCAG